MSEELSGGKPTSSPRRSGARRLLRRYLFEGEIMRLMGLSAMAKPIGMINQMVMAAFFGASSQYDAYLISLFLVSFVQQTLGRVFTATVVPYTIDLKRRVDRMALHRFQNAVYLLFLIPGVVYTLVIFFGGHVLVRLIAPRAPVETLHYAVVMLRIMALPGLALYAVAMGKATMNLSGHFRVPVSLPIVHSLVMLAAIVLLHGALQARALPTAFMLGVLAQLLVVVVAANRARLFAWVRPAISREATARLWALSWMIMVSTTFQAVNAFMDKWFASGLEPGSISSIGYSRTIMNFGIQVFTFSLVTVMFTRMSELRASGDMSGYDRYITDNLRRMTRIIVPAALALSLSAHEIVRVLFQRGAFSEADTLRTAGTMSMYLLGLPALIVNSVVTRIFHSLQMMRDKMWLALQYLVTNIVGNMILIKVLQVMGLALASTIAINLHLLLSLLVLGRYGMGLATRRYLLIIGEGYMVAATTWFLLHGSGTMRWLERALGGTSLSANALLGLTRSVITVVLFWGLLLVVRRGERFVSARSRS